MASTNAAPLLCLLLAGFLCLASVSAAGARSTLSAPAPVPSPWGFGVCPFVIQDADFVGNDISNGPEATASDCCNACKQSLTKWQANQSDPSNAVPTTTTNACLAWTFSEKQCYLKNSIQTASGGTTLTPVKGSLTGTYGGTIPSEQTLFDSVVNEDLTVLEAYNVQSATAVATSGQSVSSNSSCSAPHCELVYAAIKTQPPAAGGG